MCVCPFCHTVVTDGLLGYHYAGYQMPACVEVDHAFGPDRQRRGGWGEYLAPDIHAPSGKRGRGQTRAEKLKRQRRYKVRRTPNPAGVRL